MTLPRTLERGLRIMGSILITTVVPAWVAAIPVEYSVWAAPLLNMLFKEIRMRFPENEFVKYLPV